MPHPKVLIVSLRLDIGGTEKHLTRILPLLRKRGIDASMFAFERGGVLEQSLMASGVTVAGPTSIPRGPARVIVEMWRLYRHLRRHRPDVVHFFLPEPYIVGTMAAILAGMPLRIMSRRSLSRYHERRPMLGYLEKRLHGGTAALLGNSRAVIDQLIAECGDPSKVGLIFNGIDCPPPATPQARSDIRAELGLPPDSLVLAIVANLIPYKGHDDLIGALGIARTRLPEGWRLLVIGRDDGIGTALRQKADALGLAGHVVWLGERPNAERLLDAADVAVLVSHEEGFSNSLIEAMTKGIPAVATAVGGNLDAVAHEETGLLVPVKAPQELAEAIVRLASDRALREQFGAAARQRVQALFSLDACVARYVRLYRGCADLATVSVSGIIDHPAQEPAKP